MAGQRPGKSRKHRGWAAPLPLKIAPDRGCHAFRRARGAGRDAWPGPRPARRGCPAGIEGGAKGGLRGRPACGSPSGSLGSPGCALRRDDGELLEFPAAGERGRSGERAERSVREGAPQSPALGGALAARVVGVDFVICPQNAREEEAYLPSPRHSFWVWRGSSPALPA